MNEPTIEQIDEFLTGAEEFLAAKSDEPKPRVLLETWRILLNDIEKASTEKPGWQVSARIIRDYPGAKISDVLVYHRIFHERLIELRDILDYEISTDPECFKRTDDDPESNAHHYINLIELWQEQLVQWERDWDPADPDALMDMAACADAGNFFLGSKGLLAHLDTIGFVLTELDAESVFESVNEL